MRRMVHCLLACAVVGAAGAAELEYERPVATELSAAATDLIRTQGPKAFLDHLYELLGNAPEAKVSGDNVELFEALGFQFGAPPPYELERAEIRKNFSDDDFDFSLGIIRKAILDARDHAGLDAAATWFFDWAFGSNPELSAGLKREDVRGIGWNDRVRSASDPTISWVTFGAYLCTVILGQANDGAWICSHYDVYPVNPMQIAQLERFAAGHGGMRRIYLVNERPGHLQAISEKWPDASVWVSDKTEEEVWFIHYHFEKGEVVAHCSKRRLTPDWVESLYPKGLPKDFRKGILSLMLPDPRGQWEPIEFKKTEATTP